MKKLKDYMIKNLEDILTIIAGLIIIVNTMVINLHIGFYVLAILLIVFSYFKARAKEGRKVSEFIL